MLENTEEKTLHFSTIRRYSLKIVMLLFAFLEDLKDCQKASKPLKIFEIFNIFIDLQRQFNMGSDKI